MRSKLCEKRRPSQMVRRPEQSGGWVFSEAFGRQGIRQVSSNLNLSHHESVNLDYIQQSGQHLLSGLNDSLRSVVKKQTNPVLNVGESALAFHRSNCSTTASRIAISRTQALSRVAPSTIWVLRQLTLLSLCSVHYIRSLASDDPRTV
ncbi:protein of unknown function [Bradyrhizobium vignae]|uniref:Uncharacterized protein n=1 Tax=Bradyrhizobium vignae TaxID=1549949 RepID=A0A2U3PVI6_9BRAD|nr:protein of unknown function [Bradyrhizobium vignae]